MSNKKVCFQGKKKKKAVVPKSDSCYSPFTFCTEEIKRLKVGIRNQWLGIASMII